MNLQYANLSYASLQNANLENANLKGANLERAILINANLKGANMTSCNLFEADLLDANLSSVSLSSANLTGDLSELHCLTINQEVIFLILTCPMRISPLYHWTAQNSTTPTWRMLTWATLEDMLHSLVQKANTKNDPVTCIPKRDRSHYLFLWSENKLAPLKPMEDWGTSSGYCTRARPQRWNIIVINLCW